MKRILRLAALILTCAALAIGTNGCATSVAQWIVKESNHQGDIALRNGNYPDASVAYQLALKVDPANKHARAGLTNVQIRLAQTFFAASIFPLYKVTGASIQRSYARLKTQNNEILLALKRFDYTYDTADLAAAIRQSYLLNEEVARLTNRLQLYRQLVESGVPENSTENLAPPASL